MLIRFRVGNYRSIHFPVELVLQRRSTARSQPGRVAALYGANASGKSNVLRALSSAQRAVLTSHAQWNPSSPPPRSPFLLDPAAADEPTLFEVDALIDGTRHQYGFTLGPEVVEEEWLYSYPESRRRLLFQRGRQEFDFGRGLKGSNKAIADLVRPNSLFVSAAAMNNHEGIAPIYEWFSKLSFAGPIGGPAIPNSVTLLMLNGEEREDVERLLAVADLGIRGVTVRSEEVDPDLVKAMKELFATVAEKSATRADAYEPASTQEIVYFAHQGAGDATTPINLSNESRGTQVWFAHIGHVLTALRQGSVLVVDELDASLHPRLSSEILRLFADPETNPRGAQLIFSTHDTTLLGSLVGQRLDRDDVWFTEKDNAGATLLYPLSEFRPRKTEALERRYLQGRYGAVPIVDFGELAEQLS